MSKNINTEKQVKTLVSQRFTSFGGGGKKTPMIEIANLSGMPDCENTLLMSDSTAERFRMTNKLPRPLEEGLKTNYNLKTKTEGRGEATEFILIILPLPLRYF